MVKFTAYRGWNCVIVSTVHIIASRPFECFFSIVWTGISPLASFYILQVKYLVLEITLFTTLPDRSAVLPSPLSIPAQFFIVRRFVTRFTTGNTPFRSYLDLGISFCYSFFTSFHCLRRQLPWFARTRSIGASYAVLWLRGRPNKRNLFFQIHFSFTN